jgi:hypothetical protein
MGVFEDSLQEKERHNFKKIVSHLKKNKKEDRKYGKVADYLLLNIQKINILIEDKRKECCDPECDIETNFSKLENLVMRLEIHMDFLRKIESFLTKEKILSIKTPYRDFLFSKNKICLLTQRKYM